MNTRLVMGLAVLALAGTGCSKKGTLTVWVQDSATATLLASANVTVSPAGFTQATTNGVATFNTLDKGPVVVIVDSPGYSTKAQAVTVEESTVLTIRLSPAAKTTVKVYQGNPGPNPMTVIVPEATLSGKVVVQCYVLWTTGEWMELPWTNAIAGTVYEDRAYVGEGFVKFASYRGDALTLASGNTPSGSYKIVVTIPPRRSAGKTGLAGRALRWIE